MALKDDIFNLCTKLSQHGWRELMLSVTNNQVDIQQVSADSLVAELLKSVAENVNRTIRGFEDYRLDGNRSIEPGNFSKSLLYHALASPKVVGPSLSYYPTFDELDLVENFIYSTGIQSSATSLAHFKSIYGNKLVVGVFAFQYRSWEGSTHRVHADMNYSRTGVSRVGTNKAIYDAKRRSFWVGDNDGDISVLPCRYGAFLAIKDTGSNINNEFSIMDPRRGDGELEYIVPIHKLFDGDESLTDFPGLKLDFETYHRNEKLKRVHQNNLPNTIPINGYNLNDFPFVIDDNTQKGFLYSSSRMNGSLFITPTSGKIVEPATQNSRYVAFKVPAIDDNNRFNSSYQIAAKYNNDGTSERKSSEYVNIRQTVTDLTVKNPESDIIDINDRQLNVFNQMLVEGDYNAVDFIDRTGDGFVKLNPFGDLNSVAAYSLITAIDFFPLVNQREIFRWDALDRDLENHFAQGGTRPLSMGRIKANIHHQVFVDDSSITHTSVVSSNHSIRRNTNLVEENDSSISYLPDGASSVYAPGWDISMDIENGTPFNAAYGLGSPFPEDAKLCAALNSFWPAAAPDASRTFFQSTTLSFDFQFQRKKNTAIPLTDSELGIHPTMAAKLGIPSKRGWDGEYGPFLETVDGVEVVNYCDVSRSDYTRNAWDGHMHMDLLRKITTSNLIKRMEALRKILDILPPTTDTVVRNNLWLVSFEEIVDWDSVNDKLDVQLSGKGYRFTFIKSKGDPTVAPNDIKRLQMKVDTLFECQLDETSIVWREGNNQPNVVPTEVPIVRLISQLTS